jgi:CRISPR-associated protein Cmr1
MIKQTYKLDIITPCFCGGAEAEKQAEIRPASIRGQLRWWFRVLGGFKSLAPMDLRDQEDMIFGSAAGDEGTAGKLMVRVSGLAPSTIIADDRQMNAAPGSERGYLLFPLRGRGRGVFNESATTVSPPNFTLHLLCRGNSVLGADLQALAVVFAGLGALGFRSRRAMGALCMNAAAPMTLPAALQRFSSSQNVMIRALPASTPSDAISQLARWLQSWRSHGRTNQNPREQTYPGFPYAKSDHDAQRHGNPGYRAALGLPLLAKYGDWNQDWNQRTRKGLGRFASPVLLRPHRLKDGTYKALVLFIEARKWRDGQQACFGQGVRRAVSAELYEMMKADKRLGIYS